MAILMVSHDLRNAVEEANKILQMCIRDSAKAALRIGADRMAQELDLLGFNSQDRKSVV